MDSFEWTEKILHFSPNAFDRIVMDFIFSVSVFIPGPFAVTVGNRFMIAGRFGKPSISEILVGVNAGVWPCFSFYRRLDLLLGCPLDNFYADLPGFAPCNANNRWSVCFYRSSSSGLVPRSRDGLSLSHPKAPFSPELG